MTTSSRGRRFRPSLDTLQDRITPTAMCISPMEPMVAGWPVVTPPDAVSPMEPTVVGWTPMPLQVL